MNNLSFQGAPNSALVNVMAKAALKAAKSLLHDFSEVERLHVTRKGLHDFVTSADQRSESILLRELQKARPKFGFLSEEAGSDEGSDPRHRWIIDPLDGTSNFMHGLPQFAINIALEFDNEIIAALSYDPIGDETFWAEKGKGAFCNHRRLRVVDREQERWLIGLQFDHPAITKIKPHVLGLRYSGSSVLDLAYLAAGRLDGLHFQNLCPWDCAAGCLLLQEAGHKVIDTHDQDAEMINFKKEKLSLICGAEPVANFLQKQII